MNLHITKGNHANGLPDTQANTRSDSSVQTLDAVGVVDVLEGLAHSQVLGPVGVVLLTLHLNTDDLDRLVPSGQTTTKSGSNDLLKPVEFLAFLLVGDLANRSFGKTRQSEARTPVGRLADRDRVDAPVDTADALLTVDVHEGGEGAGGFHARSSHLMLGDLDRLHTRAETHGRVCLGNTAGHASADTTDEVGCSEGLGVVFGFRRDEEEDGTLGGSLNPGPGNETLVV